MKYSVKILALLAMLASYSISGYSQKYRFTVFVDPQVSWLTSDTKKFEPNGSVMGYKIGFAGDKYFADRYALQFGLSLNEMGGNLRYDEPNYKLVTRDSSYILPTGSNVKFKGQYINIPFGFKFKTIEIGYLSIYAQVGLTGHVKLKGFAWEESFNVDREVTTIDQADWAFASYGIGVGVEYSLGGPSAIQAGLHFSNGFTSAYKAGFGMVSIGSLSLRIGLAF
jgi:opacity protein-like surface antigen